MRQPEFIARQLCRPTGLLGRLVIEIASILTDAESAVARSLLKVAAKNRVLEIGFGAGSMLDTLARLSPASHIAGLDYSAVALRTAIARNRRHIQNGRMTLELSSSRSIPFSDESFDRVLAQNVVHFWPVLGPNLREIFRVLAPGGRLLLVYRPGDDPSFAETAPLSVYRHWPSSTVSADLEAAGFCATETSIVRVRNRNFAFTTATKSVDRQKIAKASRARAVSGENSI